MRNRIRDWLFRLLFPSAYKELELLSNDIMSLEDKVESIYEALKAPSRPVE